MLRLSSLARVLAIAAIPISLVGLYWVVFSAVVPPAGTAALAGLMCAECSCAGLLMWSWVTVVLWATESWIWEAARCTMAIILPFSCLWFILVFLGNTSREHDAGHLLLLSSMVAASLARRIAFPEANTR